MKKILLSLAVITALGANAQNPTNLVEEMDGVTPCFLGYEDVGAFQGAAGNDFTTMSYNATDGVLEIAATTHESSHGPLYYTLSGGDELECSPGEGKADVSGANSKVVLRIKSDQDVSVNLYIQEGNSPSWNYAKFSETNLTMDLTSQYQVFELTNLSSTSTAGVVDGVDLTSIGAVVFELGSTDGDYDQVSGATISVDYIRLVSSVSVNEAVVNSLNVYPNPATDQLNVVFDATSTSTVELTDLTGKVVSTQSAKAGANTISFDVINVNAGVYFVNIKNAGGNSAQKVIIK
jgi:hypothetical protein|tara:strand:- start:103 stop:978 length:876 start_codon:yes stop_codon:yes gene_type:complete